MDNFPPFSIGIALFLVLACVGVMAEMVRAHYQGAVLDKTVNGLWPLRCLALGSAILSVSFLAPNPVDMRLWSILPIMATVFTLAPIWVRYGKPI